MKLIFPGSFDPLTLGHLNIIKRIDALCMHVTIVVTHNKNKTPFMDPNVRVELIKKVLESEGLDDIDVDLHDGFIVDYCRDKNINTIIRGLRNSSDLIYEQNMYSHNKLLNNNIETMCLFTDRELSHISSSDVREIWKFKKFECRHLVPKDIADYLERM